MRCLIFFFSVLISSVSIAQIKSPNKKSTIVFLSGRIGYGYSPMALKPGGLFGCVDAGIIARNKFGIASSMQYRIGKAMAGADYRTVKKINTMEFGMTKTFVVNNHSVIDAFLQAGVGSYYLEKSILSNSKILISHQVYYVLSSTAIQYATGIRSLELSTGVRYNLPFEKVEPENSFLLFYIGIGYRGVGKK